ncbi:MAG: hypothetical protein ACEQSL_11630 [Sediminibacterium sp.]
MTQKKFIEVLTQKMMSTGMWDNVSVVSEIKVERFSYESRIRARYRVHVMASPKGQPQFQNHDKDFSHCINDAKTLNEVFSFFDDIISDVKKNEHLDLSIEEKAA